MFLFSFPLVCQGPSRSSSWSPVAQSMSYHLYLTSLNRTAFNITSTLMTPSSTSLLQNSSLRSSHTSPAACLMFQSPQWLCSLLSLSLHFLSCPFYDLPFYSTTILTLPKISTSLKRLILSPWLPPMPGTASHHRFMIPLLPALMNAIWLMLVWQVNASFSLAPKWCGAGVNLAPELTSICQCSWAIAGAQGVSTGIWPLVRNLCYVIEGLEWHPSHLFKICFTVAHYFVKLLIEK